jgi:hypothetical protein
MCTMFSIMQTYFMQMYYISEHNMVGVQVTYLHIKTRKTFPRNSSIHSLYWVVNPALIVSKTMWTQVILIHLWNWILSWSIFKPTFPSFHLLFLILSSSLCQITWAHTHTHTYTHTYIQTYILLRLTQAF